MCIRVLYRWILFKKRRIPLFISIKKSDVYIVGMFVLEHQSLSCLPNCYCYCGQRLLDVLRALIACKVYFFYRLSVVALVDKRVLLQVFIIVLF